MYSSAVLRSSPLMRTIFLAKGLRVLKFVEVFLSVAWNFYVYMFFFVITLDGECIVQFFFPIDCDFLQLLECLD